SGVDSSDLPTHCIQPNHLDRSAIDPDCRFFACLPGFSQRTLESRREFRVSAELTLYREDQRYSAHSPMEKPLLISLGLLARINAAHPRCERPETAAEAHLTWIE